MQLIPVGHTMSESLDTPNTLPDNPEPKDDALVTPRLMPPMLESRSSDQLPKVNNGSGSSNFHEKKSLLSQVCGRDHAFQILDR